MASVCVCCVFESILNEQGTRREERKRGHMSGVRQQKSDRKMRAGCERARETRDERAGDVVSECGRAATAAAVQVTRQQQTTKRPRRQCLSSQ